MHAESFEPFGFVIAEAIMNRVPVVSTVTGASMDSIEHMKNGYLAPIKNAEELAKGLFFMLENDRKKIGEAGRAKAIEMFDFEQMWDNHLKLYKSAYEKNKKIKK